MPIRLGRGRSTVLFATVILAGAAALAGPAPASAGVGSNAAYMAKPLCAKAQPGRASCFAMRLVRVAAGTRGARVVQPAAFPTGPAGGYTPGDLANASVLNVHAAAASGLVVAIVDAFN